MGTPMRYQPQRPTRLLNSGVGRGLRAAYTPGAAPSRAMPIGAVIVPTVGLGGQPEQAWTNTQKGANGTVFLPTPVVSSAEWTFLALAKCVSSSAVETICDFNDGINQGNRTSLARGAYSSGNIGSDSRPYAPDYNSATLWDNSKPGLLVVTISTAANALKIYYQGALISTTALSSSGIARVAQIQLFSKNTTSYTDPLTIGGTVSLVAFWDRAVTAQEVAALYQNPWQLFDAGSSSSAYQSAIIASAAATGGGTTDTGTLTWTEDNDVNSLVSLVTNRASITWVESNDIHSLVTLITDRAVISYQEDNDIHAISASMSGGPSYLAWTEDSDIYAIQGNVSDLGVLLWTEANDTHAMSGQVYNNVTMSWTESDDTSLITGVVTNFGTMSWTEQNDGVLFLPSNSANGSMRRRKGIHK